MAIKSDAQRKAVAKYNAANYERIELRVEKGQKDAIKAHAATYDGGSVNGFVNRAIKETMERDNKEAEAADDAFCNALYEEYKGNPDKGEAISLEDAAKELGVKK